MPDPGTDQLFILLGANLGDRADTFVQARARLTRQIGSITCQSSLYESPSWGVADQPSYLNQVLQLSTALAPDAVLTQTQAIETALGRVRHEKWGSRLIDIDLLFYGDIICQTEVLTLPHPWLHLRRFTLVPLAEIAPGFRHPVLAKTARELLDGCVDLAVPVRVPLALTNGT
jgi:2-amino-4-hydroxy-6-hydroxymethyldihydropteridine diphosphokinase